LAHANHAENEGHIKLAVVICNWVGSGLAIHWHMESCRKWMGTRVHLLQEFSTRGTTKWQTQTVEIRLPVLSWSKSNHCL